MNQLWSFVLVSFVDYDFDIRRPFFEFNCPICNCGEWYDNHEGTFITFFINQVCKQSNSLDGFTETHFICQNSIEVIVIDVPIATYDLSTDIGCNPFTVAFNAYSSNPLIADSLITFMWDFGDGTFDTIQNPSHTFDPEGTYYPALTITVGACEGFEEMTQSTTVSVLPTPEAGLLLDPPVASIYNPVVQIIDQSIGADDCILVIGGDTLNICNYTQNYYDPSQTYEDTITHYITQIVTNSFGCTDTIMVEVDVLPAYIFFAPSSFTPNGDGINDLFFGKGFGIKDFEIFIYNRWGDEIFYSKDRYEGWDGHANSGDKIAQQDVYVFVVKITDIYKMPHIVTGKVTLIR